MGTLYFLLSSSINLKLKSLDLKKCNKRQIIISLFVFVLMLGVRKCNDLLVEVN